MAAAAGGWALAAAAALATGAAAALETAAETAAGAALATAGAAAGWMGARVAVAEADNRSAMSMRCPSTKRERAELRKGLRCHCIQS